MLTWRQRAPVALVTCSLLALAAAKKSSEEWLVVNKEPVVGQFQVSEIELYSKADCSGKRLYAVQDSGYSNTMTLEKVQEDKPRSPVLHRGKDCVEACGGKSGFCDWCGVGNACCRKGFAGDPQECQRAKDFTDRKSHECVGIVGEQYRWRPHAVKVFDSDRSTSLEVACFEGNCAEGSIFIGGLVVGKVQCIRIVQPKAAQGALATAFQASRANRPGSVCPGECRSGAVRKNSEEFCTEALGKQAQCGTGPEFMEDGTDCASCKDMQNTTWDPHPFIVVHREWATSGDAVHSELRLPSRWSERLRNAGEDCSEHCAGGFCLWCGEGNACCRQNSPTDPPECSKGIGFVRRGEAECVRLYEADGFSKEPMPMWALLAMSLPAWTAAIGVLLFLTRKCFWPAKQLPEGPKQLSGDVKLHGSSQRRMSTEDKLQMDRLRQEVTKLEFLP